MTKEKLKRKLKNQREWAQGRLQNVNRAVFILAHQNLEYFSDVLIYSDEIVIEIDAIKNLKYVRQTLREILGEWSDEIRSVYCTNIDEEKNGIVVYGYNGKREDPTFKEYRIWLKVDPKNPPKKILNKDCQFVKNEEVKTTYEFVCEKGQKK